MDLTLEPLDEFVVIQPVSDETETRSGLILPASAAAAVAMSKSRNDVWTVAAAAASALAVQQMAPGGWPIVAAGIMGAIVGYLRWKPAGSTAQ